MTLADLGNIGEIVGGLAVMVSVLYLAVQIRQSSRISKFEAHRSLSVSMTSIINDVARDPEMYRIWKAAVDTPDEASYDDRERFGMILYQAFTAFSDADRFADIDSDLVERYHAYLDRYLRMPVVLDWWSRQGQYFPEHFRRRVEKRLAYLAETESADLDEVAAVAKNTPDEGDSDNR